MLINKLCFTPYKDKLKFESSLLDYMQIAFASDTRRDTRTCSREERSLHITKNALPCNIPSIEYHVTNNRPIK